MLWTSVYRIQCSIPESRAMIIFNLVGLVMFAISFGVAFLAGGITGTTAEGPLMIIAGPLLAACDATYRWKHPAGHWFYPDRGGSLFFLPAWTFGLLWLVLGIVYTVQGRS